jgi:zinc transport system substrate-binding protein
MIANEVGAATAVLDTIETLSNKQIADGANYVSVMQSNLAALEKGLVCS